VWEDKDRGDVGEGGFMKINDEGIDLNGCGCSPVNCVLKILAVLALIYLFIHRVQIWELVTR
jgi:hypothetical protein